MRVLPPNGFRLARQRQCLSQVTRAQRDADLQRWAPRNWKLVEVVTELGGRVTKADVLEQGVSGAGLEWSYFNLHELVGLDFR